MSSGRVLLAAVLVGLCFALWPAQAHAHCGLTRLTYVKLIETEVVFVGTVTSSSLLHDGEEYREFETEFDVMQVWKGNLPDVVRLRTLDLKGMGCCPSPDGSRPDPDEPMLIYSDGGRLGACAVWDGFVSQTRRELIEIAAVFVLLTALPSTVLLLTLSKAMRSYMIAS